MTRHSVIGAGLRSHAVLGLAAVVGFSVGAGAVMSLASARSRSTPEAARLLCEDYAGLPAAGSPAGARLGMVRIPAGRFTMGSDQHYPEERAPHHVELQAFWMDRHDVTNAQFAQFVAATQYVTVAERGRDAARFPDLPQDMRVAGSIVFKPGRGPEPGQWTFQPGANWRHPEGPESDLSGRDGHPVVHIAYEDAMAYARWLGRELPTEAQWEYAARGGLEGEPYVWGRELAPNGKPMANIWTGTFPWRNTAEDGYAGTSPVGCFAPNGYGLYDMAGNVWQWTDTWYRPGHAEQPEADPAGPSEGESFDPVQPGVSARVIKGGSHLCAPNYCARYRPAARQAREPAFGTSHLGFRTVARDAS